MSAVGPRAPTVTVLHFLSVVSLAGKSVQASLLEPLFDSKLAPSNRMWWDKTKVCMSETEIPKPSRPSGGTWRAFHLFCFDNRRATRDEDRTRVSPDSSSTRLGSDQTNSTLIELENKTVLIYT